jgi:alcohol dehydrogenase class IV
LLIEVKKVNIFKKIYCRTFQFVFKIALPILPYRDPKIVNCLVDIPQVIKNNGKCKPLIVTDKNIRGLGLTKSLEESLTSNGIPYEIYDEVVANPTTDNVYAAHKLFCESGCDCLIAFGGGSHMDCAKGVGALCATKKKDINKLAGILKVRRKIPMLIAIPTTAGTGSETTLACVIVDAKTRHKYAINSFPLIPSCAVLDESVTATLPKKIVATTGMDALTHAIESYIGKSGNKGTRQDALTAIKLIFENIENAYQGGDAIARKNMLYASHLAGRSFSKAYVGYVHSLAHALGGKYDTPHGLANAVILPIVLGEYGKAAYKKLYKIAVYCNLVEKGCPTEQGATAVINKIEQLNARMDIPARLNIIKQEHLDELAGYAEKEANPLYPVPVLWDKEKLKEVYKKIGGYYYAESNLRAGNLQYNRETKGVL